MQDVSEVTDQGSEESIELQESSGGEEREFIVQEKKVDGKEELRLKWLKGLPVKYLYMALIGLVVIGVFYLLLRDGKVPESEQSMKVDPQSQISEELYQRKNVSLDDIEAIASSQKRRKQNGSSGLESTRYRKGQYVESQGDSSTQKSRSASGQDSPINIFSDPRYVVSAGYENSSGRLGTSLKIPTGTILHAYLEREMSVSQKGVPVIGIVYYTGSDGQSKYIPEGSRVVGRISSVSGDRVLINFNGGVLPDGNKFSFSGVAMGEDYGTTYEGIAGIVDHNVGRRGGSILASSALRATRTLTSLTGGSWGSVFAGEVADQTMDEMDDEIDNGLDTYGGPEVILPANTRFQILVR